MLRVSTVVIYTALLAALSLSPGPEVPQPDWVPEHIDKAAHFAAYCLYTFLLIWSIPLRRRNGFARIVIILIYCTAFGALMESLQALLHPDSRQFSIADMIANAAGSLAMCVAARATGYWEGPGARRHAAHAKTPCRT